MARPSQDSGHGLALRGARRPDGQAFVTQEAVHGPSLHFPGEEIDLLDAAS